MCIFATQCLVIGRSRTSVYKRSAGKHHLSRWGTKTLLHFLHLYSLSCWSWVSTISSWITCSLTTGGFFIFIEHQHLGLGLTQLLQYMAKYSCMLLALSNFKKRSMSAQTTSDFFIQASIIYHVYLYSGDGFF